MVKSGYLLVSTSFKAGYSGSNVPFSQI